MNQKLIKIISKLFARFYFLRKDYSEPIYNFLSRIGWKGIISEGISHLSFLMATEKCIIAPRLVRFEVSSRCNIKCPMCPQPEKMTRPKKNMEYRLYEKVLESNTQIREVDLFNWGEPLLNPDIIRFVKYASDKHILTRFVTNATLLSKKMSVQLIDAGINEIYFSLDNIDDRYEKIRKHSFIKVVGNIAAFMEVAKKSGRRIRTGINIVKSRHNQHGIEHAVAVFEKLGIDNVLVEEDQFEEKDRERISRCFEPYRNITVLSNGDVVPCCVDYDGVLSMGSVWRQPDLKTIFNNKYYRRLRRSFRSVKDMHQICAQCSYRSVPVKLLAVKGK